MALDLCKNVFSPDIFRIKGCILINFIYVLICITSRFGQLHFIFRHFYALREAYWFGSVCVSVRYALHTVKNG